MARTGALLFVVQVLVSGADADCTIGVIHCPSIPMVGRLVGTIGQVGEVRSKEVCG